MADVYANVREVAPQKFPVLVTGETGTGKELIARLLHEEGRHKSGRFVEVNCAAVPHELWESEVFGHVRGAFTDARQDKSGYVEQAAGGTLFFDEIGEMPLDVQPKILRLLQEKSFRKVGASTVDKTDCRLVFATNRDLSEMVSQGLFRKDLFYRISVIRIKLPALRERKEEIPLLVEHMLAKYCPELEKNIRFVEKGALDSLCRYHWPGNIRELENAVIQSVLACKTEGLTLDNLPLPVRESRKEMIAVDGSGQRLTGGGPRAPVLGVNSLEDMLNEYARKLIEKALSDSGNSGPQAAELLRVKPGKLYYQMSKLGIKTK